MSTVGQNLAEISTIEAINFCDLNHSWQNLIKSPASGSKITPNLPEAKLGSIVF
jgi:hypothetical protein